MSSRALSFLLVGKFGDRPGPRPSCLAQRDREGRENEPGGRQGTKIRETLDRDELALSAMHVRRPKTTAVTGLELSLEHVSGRRIQAP